MNFDFCCNQILINEQNFVHKSRLYIDNENFSDIIIISGRNASIYEIKANKVLASHSLNKTILKELLTNGTIGSTTPILINMHFAYNAGEKELFFFIRIGDRLVILTKMSNQFMIKHQHQNVRDYELDDSNDSGNSEAVITFLNGDTEVIELNNSKINLSQTLVPNLFSKLTNELRYIVMDASSKSFQLNLEFQERLADYNSFNQLNFTENSNSGENFNILSRFGDTWTRNIDDILLIGIPVYNCSNQKYLIKDLRVSLFKQTQKQICFKHSIYEFHGNVLNNKSTGTHNIYATEQHTDIATNPEWTDMNNVLVAGKSGIILIKLSTLSVGVVQSPPIIIISYKIEMPNAYSYDFSTHIGRIEHVDRILHEDDVQLKFDSTNYFQDILTITATTVIKTYQFQYDSDDDLQELFEILTKHLQFKDILQTFDSEDKYFLSTQMNLSTTDDDENFDDDAKVFYCDTFGYWKGTMVQGMVSKCAGIANHQKQSYEIKIYNREEIKIQDLIKLIYHHFGSRISIKSVQSNQNRQLELKYRFREEITALEQIAKQMPNKSRNASLTLIPFLNYQLRTDQSIEIMSEYHLNNMYTRHYNN